MKRWTRSLKQHIDIAEKHAADLVRRFKVNGRRLAKLQDKYRKIKPEDMPIEVENTFIKLYEITDELIEVEDWVKNNWPEITELFNTVRAMFKEMD